MVESPFGKYRVVDLPSSLQSTIDTGAALLGQVIIPPALFRANRAGGRTSGCLFRENVDESVGKGELAYFCICAHRQFLK